MATWSDLCEIVAALPGTELDRDRPNAAWRVRGAVLARRYPRLRIPEEDEVLAANGEAVAIRIDREERELLTQHDPDTFFFTPHWTTSPHVLVWLRKVQNEELRKLLVDAWRAVAQKLAVREFEG